MSKIKFKCSICGKEVEDYKNNRSKYCSKECAYKGRVGEGNGMFGRRHNLTTKKIFSKQRKGVGLENHGRWMGGKPRCKNCGKLLSTYNLKTNLCGECIKEFLVGENAGNWQGGLTPINDRIRKSKEYKLWRKAVLERDNYTCIWCGTTKNLTADHIKPFSLFPELRFAIDNGRTLCMECHRKTDTYGGRVKCMR